MAAIAKDDMMIALTARDETSQAFNAVKSRLLDVKGQVDRVRGVLSGALAGDIGNIASLFLGIPGPVGIAFKAITVGMDIAKASSGAFFEAINRGSKTTEELLAEQARLIGQLKTGYGEAASEAEKFVAQLSALTRVQEDQNRFEIERRRLQQVQGALAGMGRINLAGTASMAGMPGHESELQFGDFEALERFKAFTKQILELRDGLAGGAPDIAKFNEEIASMILANPGLRDVGQSLLALVAGIDSLDPDKIKKTREELERAASIKTKDAAIAGFRSLLESGGEASADQLKTFKFIDFVTQRAKALEGGMDPAAVERAFTAAVAELNKKEEEAADAFDNATQKIKDQTKEVELQAAMMGRAGPAVTRMKTEHDLLRAAMKAGRDITPELREEIKRLADDYTAASERMSRNKLIGDLAFERGQLGRTGLDQTIASRLRGANLAVDLNSKEAGLIRANEALRDMRDLTLEVAQGINRDVVSAMRAGASAADVFGKATLSALQRLSDKLMDRALTDFVNQTFGAIARGTAGGGGGYNWLAGQDLGNAGYARGGVFSGGRVMAFAGGGIVGGPTIFPMANGIGLMGEAGPEAIMPLKRGSDGRLGVVGSDRSGYAAPIIHNYGADVEYKGRNDEGRDEFVVRGLIRDEIASPRSNGVMRKKTGTRPPLIQR